MTREHPYLQRLCDGLAIIGFAGLVVVAMLSLIDVTLRTLTLPRLSGINDIREVALAVIVASCFPLGLLKGNNVTVRILSLVVSAKTGYWFEFIASLVTLIFYGIVVITLGAVVMNMSLAGRTTSTLELPMAPWLWAIQVTIIIALVVQLVICWDRLLDAWQYKKHYHQDLKN